MGTLHCALENGADLYVNERHKIRDYRAMSTEEIIRIKGKKNIASKLLLTCSVYDYPNFSIFKSMSVLTTLC